MRVIVHAGMHKTGSSSIQQTLHKHAFPGITYAPWRTSNHSGQFVLLFHEEPEHHVGFQKNGAPADSLRKQRAEWLEKFDRALGNCSDTFVISAEAISAGHPSNVAAQRKMVAHLRKFTDDIELVVYVRPPAGYMQSAFQQKVKGGGLASFDLERRWPNYRQRFQPLIDSFSDFKVSLRLFDRNKLTGGDVVTDFVQSLGAEIAPEQVIQANESLSIEALSLLYTQRRLGHGLISGFPKSMSANARLISALQDFGSGKVQFSREALIPVFETHAEDLAWMESKLGVSISDLPDTDRDHAIATEEDIFAVAETQAEKLDAYLRAHVDNKETRQHAALSRNLDLLYLDAMASCFDSAPNKRKKPKNRR
ncbi:MAG: hypothetical protein ACE369_17610 [Roseovarius sp.]